MLVKICGITRGEDADAAVAAGAHALGFVFWPGSPRFIEPSRAGAIIRTLPPSVTPIGVFVNQSRDDVARAADVAGLAAVQLHGEESPTFAAALDRPVIKAVPVEEAEPEIEEWPAGVMLLLDVHDPEKRGGTGRTIDWQIAGRVAATRPAFLAGGLKPENVAEAVRLVRPYGIDVSSGVERVPGEKDHARLHALFEVIHGIRDDAARS